MRELFLPRTPLAPGAGPARIAYREAGAGHPVVVLHGGWGYGAYPFDEAIAGLAPNHRVIAPDRTGYGRSGRLADLPPDFHRRMAEETLLVLDALGVGPVAAWGHSDGAVIAAWLALLAPERVTALVLEALHATAVKPGSLAFFRTGVEAPERFGPEVVRALEADHGPSWREVVAAGGRAWLHLIARATAGEAEVLDGRLAEVRAPTLLVHGDHDPRTEPGELETARRALPHARLELLPAGHSPHTSRRAGADCLALAAGFLAAHPA